MNLAAATSTGRRGLTARGSEQRERSARLTQDKAIQLTAPGTAALAVVRLCGPGAAALVAAHFDRPTPARVPVHGRWGGLDDPLVLFDGGEQFDVSLHGGTRIVARLLEQARAAGFEVVVGDAAIEAAAGDDEVAAWLPRATTAAGLRMLLHQPAAWANLANVDAAALLEDRTLRRLLTPARVALVGAANVGKSTLANRLGGRDRSLVADVPGTTRDWVGHAADLGGLPVVLVDTPGRRATDDAIEVAAVELSQPEVSRADLVVLVLDATRPGDAPSGFAAALVVANKTDLAGAPAAALPVSAATGAGVDALVRAIHERLGVDLSDPARANVWTPRQETALRTTRDAT